MRAVRNVHGVKLPRIAKRKEMKHGLTQLPIRKLISNAIILYASDYKGEAGPTHRACSSTAYCLRGPLHHYVCSGSGISKGTEWFPIANFIFTAIILSWIVMG